MNKNTINLILVTILFLILSQSTFLYNTTLIYFYRAILAIEFIILWDKLLNTEKKSYKIISNLILLIVFSIYIICKNEYFIEEYFKTNIILVINIIALIVINLINKSGVTNIKKILLLMLIPIFLTIILNIIAKNIKAESETYITMLAIFNIIVQFYFYKKSIEIKIDNQNLTNIDKIIVIFIVAAFTIYNIYNFSKLLKNYNETSNFIQNIEVNTEEDYTLLLNNYKSTFDIQRNKEMLSEYQEEYEENQQIYSDNVENSIFIYDNLINLCNLEILTTERVIISNAIQYNNQYTNKRESYNTNINFLKSMSENLIESNKIQKNAGIVLLVNTILTSMMIIYCIRINYNKKNNNFSNIYNY